MSASEIWEIKYRGAELPKLFNYYEFESAQKFVNKVDIISIVFYASAITEPVEGRSRDIGRIYEETLTKDDLAGVSMKWIEERRKRY